MMEFLIPISIMVFLNLFLIFKLIYMATMYTLSKDVRPSQFRLYESEFPDRHLSARQQLQNIIENQYISISNLLYVIFDFYETFRNY